MTETVTLSFRVPAKKAKALARLATAQERSKSYVLEKALDELIAYDEWFRKKVSASLANIEAGGPLIEDAAMAQWIKALPKQKKRSAPKAKVRTQRRAA